MVPDGTPAYRQWDELVGLGLRMALGDSEALRQHGFAHLERADSMRIDDKRILHFWSPLRPAGVSVRVDLLVGDAAEHARFVERAVPGNGSAPGPG